MNVGEIVGYDQNNSVVSIKSSIKNVGLGDSICCSGVCLTIMGVKKKIIEFNISSETKKKNKPNKFKSRRSNKFRKIIKSW